MALFKLFKETEKNKNRLLFVFLFFNLYNFTRLKDFCKEINKIWLPSYHQGIKVVDEIIEIYDSNSGAKKLFELDLANKQGSSLLILYQIKFWVPIRDQNKLFRPIKKIRLLT